MDSIAKVRARLDELQALQPADQAVAAAQMFLLMARGKIEALLPESAAALDDLLHRGAAWALSLRSDDATRIALVPEPARDGAAAEPAAELA